MTALADLLPRRTSRDYLLRLIADAAINDAEFRANLIADPSPALAVLFGRNPPTDRYDFRVVVEDQSTYYFVIPHAGLLRNAVRPPTISPRSQFESRLNSILFKDPSKVAEFKANPLEFIANTLQFRLPASLEVVPIDEQTPSDIAKQVVYVVLRYPPHDALFRDSFSMRFQQATSQAVVAPSASLDSPLAVTVECWFRASAFASGNWQNAVISRHGQASGYELRVGEAIPRFMVTVGGVHYYAQPDDLTPLLTVGRWYYVAGIYTGSELSLYLDGTYLYGMPVTGPIDQDSGPLAIGNNSNPAWVDRNFSGDIDEVRIWGRALGGDEVRGYQRRGRRKRLSDQEARALRDGELRLYFPCNEGNGTSVYDQSGNSNNGTLSDVAWVSDTPTG